MVKRFFALLIGGALCATVAFGQQRVLVSPYGEVIPLRPGDDVAKVAKKHGLTDVSKTAKPSSILACPTTVKIGNSSGNVGGFTFSNGDTWLVRFVAPVDGAIQEVWFRSNSGSSGPEDTTAIVRIFTSTITPSSFGYSGTEWIGFYRYPGDPNGIGNAPWKDLTTDTTFVDTNAVGGGKGGTDPNGDEIWGLGGFTTTWPNAAVNNQVVMQTALGYEPSVLKGDVFNVNIRVPPQSASGHSEIAQIAENNANSFNSFWKYYYRGRGAVAGDTGWWARGAYNMRLWVVLRATGDLPPNIASFDQLGNTLSTAARTVTLTAYDCNAANPADTGVASAAIVYSTDGGTTWNNVAMTLSSGVWSGDIPGFAFPTQVKYYCTVTDIHSNTQTSGSVNYQCLSLIANGMQITMPTYNWVDITASGTQIPESGFYDNVGSTPPHKMNSDDGTAGPFDMGAPFSLFGTPLQFAFVGVNGAVCLSPSATDTLYIGSSTGTGVFYTNYIIPYAPGATVQQNAVNVLYNDLAAYSSGAGSIYTQASGTQFIVEYVGVGNFVDTSTASFEVIFDRADTSITIQYNTLGTAGLESSGLVGIEVDDVNKFIEANYQGTPPETQPANGTALRFTPVVTGVKEGKGTPFVFSLSANYPNPFNPTTKINYSIASGSNVKLSVFNVLGQEVATLVNGYKAPGEYTVNFEGKSLASGVYFYSLKAGSYTNVKKMVLMK